MDQDAIWYGVDVYSRTKWHLHTSSRLVTIDTGQKLGPCTFHAGDAGSPSNTTSLGRGLPRYQVAYCSIQQFGHNRYGPKIGGSCAPLGEGELGRPLLAQCGLSRDLSPCQVASSSIQPFRRNRYGPKIGGSAPFWGRGLGHHLTQCRLG